MIRTTQLQFIVCERAHSEAFARGKNDLAAMLQVTIPESWPTFPEAFTLPTDASPQVSTGWDGYFFVHSTNQVLLGNGGFTGPPDETNTVEIGYEIASEYWNRGFATEAVLGMLAYAFEHDSVQNVIAHTLGFPNSSNKVLQKVDMKFIDEIDDPDDGKIWQWRISRDEYKAFQKR